MNELARDPAALEQLQAQRDRLADRMRPPWWYLAGAALVWAVAFGFPFTSRYVPHGLSLWPFLVAALVVACVLQWGLTRATGISVGFPDLTYRPGRPARITMLVVSLAAITTEHLLIDRDLIVAAIVVAALAVVAGVVGMQAAIRGIRNSLRAGEGAA